MPTRSYHKLKRIGLARSLIVGRGRGGVVNSGSRPTCRAEPLKPVHQHATALDRQCVRIHSVPNHPRRILLGQKPLPDSARFLLGLVRIRPKNNELRQSLAILCEVAKILVSVRLTGL